MNLVQQYRLARLALKYPGMTTQKIRQRLVYGRRGQTRKFPSLVCVNLFPTCNLRCRMCGQWRRRRQTPANQTPTAMLSITKLRRLVDEAAFYQPELYVWGGEPTLHPEFSRFITYAKQKRLVCTVNTNGTRLKQVAPALCAAGLDSLDISLDGPEAIHDAIRGVSGTYQKIMAGLEALNRPKGGRRPLVKAVITLSRHNIGQVVPLLITLEAHPVVDMYIIQLGWFVTTRAGRRHEQRLKADFGLAGTSWRGFQDDHAGGRADRVVRLMSSIEKLHLRKPLLVFPSLSGADLARYFTHHGERFGRKSCQAVYREVNIAPSGDVTVCLDYPDIVVGNIHQQSLYRIWHGSRLAAMRGNLAHRGLLPVCSRCCGFFR